MMDAGKSPVGSCLTVVENHDIACSETVEALTQLRHGHRRIEVTGEAAPQDETAAALCHNMPVCRIEAAVWRTEQFGCPTGDRGQCGYTATDITGNGIRFEPRKIVM